MFLEASLLKGDDKATKEDVEKWTKPLLDEFLNTLYFEEALKEISDKFSKNTINMFFEQVFDEVRVYWQIHAPKWTIYLKKRENEKKFGIV